MNQILSTSNNPNNQKTVNIRKVIKIFCILLILFALTTMGIAGYNIYNNKIKNTVENKPTKPEIVIEEMEDETIKISVKYDLGLSTMSYIWNGTNRTDSNLDGKTYIEKQIEIPDGLKNKLEIIALGTDGKKETLSREFISEGDSTDPEIDWVVSGTLQIIATDDVGLKYITYQWEGEQAVLIRPTDDLKKIDQTIEIKRGTNELTITAVDTSGNSSSKTRTFQGVKEPEISWTKIGRTVEMTITHDMGFKKIIFIVNNVEYVYDSNYSGYNKDQTEVKFKTDLNVGENTIIIKAYSNEGSEKIKEGKATYNP